MYVHVKNEGVVYSHGAGPALSHTDNQAWSLISEVASVHIDMYDKHSSES